MHSHRTNKVCLLSSVRQKLLLLKLMQARNHPGSCMCMLELLKCTWLSAVALAEKPQQRLPGETLMVSALCAVQELHTLLIMPLCKAPALYVWQAGRLP